MGRQVEIIIDHDWFIHWTFPLFSACEVITWVWKVGTPGWTVWNLFWGHIGTGVLPTKGKVAKASYFPCPVVGIHSDRWDLLYWTSMCFYLR